MSDLPESLPATPVAEVAPQPPAADSAPPVVVAEAAPRAAGEPAATPPSPEPAAVEAVAAPVRRKPAKRSVSDDTLAAWQQRLEQDRAAERRRQQAAVAKAERRQAFRLARQALERCADVSAEPAIDPALAALADDQLARAVHAAPERIRTVIAATLRLLQTKR